MQVVHEIRQPPQAGPNEEEDSPRTMGSSSGLPTIDPVRAGLLDSIRSVGGAAALKPSAERPMSPSPNQKPSGSSDLMAGMLAKALAERNKKIAHGNLTPAVF